MRFAKFMFVLAAILVAGIIGSEVVRQSYVKRAERVQRVQQDPGADALFGDAGTPVGSPQMLIIDDPKAFVKGDAPAGVRLVSENYLTAHKEYPLQLQTVEYVAQIVRVGLAAGTTFFIGLGLFLARRARRLGTVSDSSPVA